MSEGKASIGSIIGWSMVEALRRVSQTAGTVETGTIPNAVAEVETASIDRLMDIVLEANRQPCSRCGNAPGTHEIPGRSGRLYCPNCWWLLHGERVAEQDLAQEHSCAGCSADTAVGRFHNRFGLPDLEKWDKAWLCEGCLVGIMKRLARLLLREFDKAPQKKVGECACCGGGLEQVGFKVYRNWRGKVPKPLTVFMRWQNTILCGECGRKLRTANAVLVPISDEDRKKGKKHPFWTGRFEVRPPTAPALEGVEVLTPAVVAEAAETKVVSATVTATATA